MSQTHLTISQAADALGVSPRTVRREIDNGQITITKIASCIRIASADLHDYVQRRRVGGPQ